MHGQELMNIGLSKKHGRDPNRSNNPGKDAIVETRNRKQHYRFTERMAADVERKS